MDFIAAFNNWSEETQLIFCLVVLGILSFTLVLMWVTLLRTLRIVLRGYPPSPVQECNNDYNLTGNCLKPGGCKTQEECSTTVRGRE